MHIQGVQASDGGCRDAAFDDGRLRIGLDASIRGRVIGAGGGGQEGFEATTRAGQQQPQNNHEDFLSFHFGLFTS